ncbi:hypothetical protein DFH06DRAFT_1134492 [Mycena polygramma]|nr:hypothetical protein DFH06DRAFT_1134492 [Mycena polygramma]
MQSPITPTRRFSGFVRRARSLTLDSIVGGKPRSRRGSNAGSVVYSLMPPELWVKVFSHIPLYLLPSITLTCRSFRSLAQPLLFTTIVTHPQAPSSLTARATHTKYRKRVAERLQFFFSPQISLTVRECKISQAAPEEDGVANDDLIDYIFDTLPKLPNLQVLECRHVQLTPQRLAVLQRLHLTSITLELCFGEMSDFAAAPAVPMRDVTFKYPDSSLRGDKASPCPVFLSPTHLEYLHATTTVVLASIIGSQPFSKLRSLELPVGCLSSTSFIPALLRCPAVEHLSLHTSFANIPPAPFEALPDGVLPLLKSYRGPHYFAACFLSGRSTERVEISMSSRPHRLEASFVKLHHSLKSLSFSLSTPDLPPSLLETIHLAFPALADLSVHQPALSSHDLKAVLNAVSAHAALTELALRVQGRDKFNLWIPPEESAADAVSCFNKVRTALVKTYPHIQRVRFFHGAEGASIAWARSSASGLFVRAGE